LDVFRNAGRALRLEWQGGGGEGKAEKLAASSKRKHARKIADIAAAPGR
jgi:hypothetical protein